MVGLWVENSVFFDNRYSIYPALLDPDNFRADNPPGARHGCQTLKDASTRTIGHASYCAGPDRGDHNDVRSFTEDGQELLHQAAVPYPCDEKHISRRHAGNYAKNELSPYFAREVL